MLTVGLALALFPPALVRADDGPKGDKDLDGEWRSTSFSFEGKESGDGNTTLTIDGDNLTFRLSDSADHKTTAMFKVDSSKTPHTIDMTPQDGPEKGKVSLGIYEVKGDELRLCHAAPGLDRPTEFVSGDHRSVMVFKRVKK